MNKISIDSHKGKYTYELVDDINQIFNKLEEHENIDLILIDNNIKLNFPDFIAQFKQKIKFINVNPQTKSIHFLPKLLETFSLNSLRKNSEVVVVGGATLQDIAATACNLFHRGINWIFIPTTGISQGDSCIGSKTSLDGENSKNQFGVFHPPKRIISCKDFLLKIEEIEIISGLGDILHYLTPYKMFDQYLSRFLEVIADKNRLIKLSHELSYHSMNIKSEMVEIDEFDIDKRNIFNFGHSYGHAIEKSSNSYVPHGIAVLMGIFLAINTSFKNNSHIPYLDIQAEKIRRIIQKLLITYFNDDIIIEKDFFIKKLSQDKKNLRDNYARLIVPVEKNLSIWNCARYEPLYGLARIEISLSQCCKILDLMQDFDKVLVK
tara:strand:+ start:1517 stop:2650 length:1134 start_codon:yes stop_codon:yes gene_type:complete